ncbi:MAG: hypothetical protein ACE14S_11180 [Candidatus Bathyarchaeia archaeon]
MVSKSKSRLEVYVGEEHAAVTDSKVENLSRAKRKEEAEQPIYLKRV